MVHPFTEGEECLETKFNFSPGKRRCIVVWGLFVSEKCKVKDLSNKYMGDNFNIITHPCYINGLATNVVLQVQPIL